MIDPKFHLQPQADKLGQYPILLLFSVNGKRIQYYSGLKAPRASKPIKGKDKVGKYPFKEFTGSASVKMKLESLRSHAKAIENELISKGLPQSIEVYKAELDKRFKGRDADPPQRQHSVEDRLTEYLDKVKADLSHNTFRSSQSGLNHFRGFLGKSANELTVNHIDETLIERFNEYLKDGRLNNTVVKSMQVLRTFLQYCLKKKYIGVLPSIEPGSPNNITVIHLSYDEVMRVYKAAMPNDRLEKVRDFFVFGCFTGMRYGDIAGLTKSNIFNDHIKFFNEKNGTTQSLTVPLTQISAHIVAKYKDVPGVYALPSVSNQKTNNYLKEVAEIAGLTDVVEIASKDAYGKIKKVEHRKFELITCHVSRKSFITIAMTLGMPESTIVSITGHSKGSKAFHKYYDVVNQTKFDQMKMFNK
jgi:integrase